MGDLRRIDRRREERVLANLAITVWGVDTRGERFLQQATARDISLSGALLTGLEAELKSGDVVGVLYAGKKARFRVVWLRYSDSQEKIQAAVQRIETEACPWMDVLVEEWAPSTEDGDAQSPSR